jgi:hypothetical protein
MRRTGQPTYTLLPFLHQCILSYAAALPRQEGHVVEAVRSSTSHAVELQTQEYVGCREFRHRPTTREL